MRLSGMLVECQTHTLSSFCLHVPHTQPGGELWGRGGGCVGSEERNRDECRGGKGLEVEGMGGEGGNWKRR